MDYIESIATGCSGILPAILAVGLSVLVFLLVILPITGIYKIKTQGWLLSRYSIQLLTIRTILRQGGRREALRIIRSNYDQTVAAISSFLFVVGIAVFAYAVGQPMNRCARTLFFPDPLIIFRSSELRTLWTVHATVIALSLVGLSFAWESVRNLSSTEDVIAEVAIRLRSSETIVFLLVSNIAIGLGVLLSDGHIVSPSITLPVGILFVISIIVAVERYRFVFNLLLFNTIDEFVTRLGESEINHMEDKITVDSNELLAERLNIETLSAGLLSTAFLKSSGTSITANEVSKGGRVSDLKVNNLRSIVQIVSDHDDQYSTTDNHDSNPDENVIQILPSIGRHLRSNSTVFMTKSDLDGREIDEVKKKLRSAIKTKKN